MLAQDTPDDRTAAPVATKTEKGGPAPGPPFFASPPKMLQRFGGTVGAGSDAVAIGTTATPNSLHFPPDHW